MNKKSINRFLSKFGFEVHGTGYIQSVKKSDFKQDIFTKQLELTGNKAEIIFDVGANRGNVTLKYADTFPKSKIYAFEPFEEAFKILSSKSVANPRIHLNQIGIAEFTGTKTFYENVNMDTNSTFEPDTMGLSSDNQVKNVSISTIPVITIDEFCLKHQINKIDILKMDIQGGELNALKGASDLLSKKAVGLIFMETYFREQYKNQPLFHDVSKYLHEWGYYVQDFYEPIYGKGSLAWCDVIFMPQSKRK
ncbi:MAG TPA: FkbM family methyltransferase [Ferruginibacter sp.]|nr:FkbM family methyltransferase [Ferruginibacter sp.]HRO05242.1 FkbM family methyltransferase [Ferruginibacter sp.]HRO96004.1 FkbM family methyltransferase [Ferruginibacter sp.]HRP48662.1 FkbM family methyltransferase [Ferruginibacter sp.]